MHIPSLGEAELLVPLHEGVFEQPLWHTFLERLRRESGSRRASLSLSPREGGDSLELASGEKPASHLDFAELREGRVYSANELAPEAEVDFRIIRWSDERLVRCELRLEGGGIASSATALMSALLPHLKTAVRVFTTLEMERTRRSVKEEALRRMNFGWILLDAKCRILEHDSQAGENLDRAGLLKRGPYERLIPTAAGADRELTRQVANCSSDPDARPRTINLGRDPWVDILVAPFRPQSPMGSAAAVAAVYLRGDRTSSAERQEQLVELFQLTPSEARLAWTIAQGLSIAEAASEHGLTVETARNYSKKIYAKTGARGQADLVRHVLTSVLAMR